MHYEKLNTNFQLSVGWLAYSSSDVEIVQAHGCVTNTECMACAMNLHNTK